jgi:hypothetical protein
VTVFIVTVFRVAVFFVVLYSLLILMPCVARLVLPVIITGMPFAVLFIGPVPFETLTCLGIFCV